MQIFKACVDVKLHTSTYYKTIAPLCSVVHTLTYLLCVQKAAVVIIMARCGESGVGCRFRGLAQVVASARLSTVLVCEGWGMRNCCPRRKHG